MQVGCCANFRVTRQALRLLKRSAVLPIYFAAFLMPSLSIVFVWCNLAPIPSIERGPTWCRAGGTTVVGRSITFAEMCRPLGDMQKRGRSRWRRPVESPLDVCCRSDGKRREDRRTPGKTELATMEKLLMQTRGPLPRRAGSPVRGGRWRMGEGQSNAHTDAPSCFDAMGTRLPL